MVSTAPPTPWLGRLDLRFGWQPDRGTYLRSTYAQAPLKVQRPFYTPQEQACELVMVHTAGGMVGGDRLHINAHLEPQSHVRLTSPTAQKIYRSLGPTSEQTIHLYLDSGCLLEWVPLETIVFHQAHYHQHINVVLAPGAHWVGWDITRFGRTAQGETFDQGTWRSSLAVWQQDYPLWIDRQLLQNPGDLLSTSFGLGGQPVWGTLLLLGREIDRPQRDQWRSSLETAGHGEPHFHLSRTQQGLVYRYRGPSSQQARSGFIHLWTAWKRSLFDQTPAPSRLWI